MSEAECIANMDKKWTVLSVMTRYGLRIRVGKKQILTSKDSGCYVPLS